jgi:hypothetical protein
MDEKSLLELEIKRVNVIKNRRDFVIASAKRQRTYPQLIFGHTSLNHD